MLLEGSNIYGAVNFWLDRYGKAKQVKEPVALAVKLSGIKLPNQGRSNPAYWSGRDKAIDWMMNQGVAKVVHTAKDLNVNYNGQLTRKQWRWIEDYAKKHGLKVVDDHGNVMADYNPGERVKESADRLVQSLFEGDVIGVDLDGTLAAHYEGDFDPEKIGDPVPEMVEKVKAALEDGKTVKIFTARASDKKNIDPIKQWLKANDLPDFEITNEKTPEMAEIWDDRARNVERDTGEFSEEVTENIVRRLFEDLEPVAGVDYPLAGDVVDGREVLENVDNVSSISASLEDYEVLDGIRELPMSDFYTTGTHYSAEGTAKIRRLAEMIAHNNAISPLIVVVDSEGPYVLEGGTRLEALHLLGAKSFPALVVVDFDV